MDRRRRREREGRRAKGEIELALRSDASVGERAAGMIAAVEGRLVDLWFARVAATFGDESALEAGFEPLDVDHEIPLGLGLVYTKKARREGWEFVNDPFSSRIGIYPTEDGPATFKGRWQAEAWVRDRAAEGDEVAIMALLLVIAKHGEIERWTQFRAAMTPFNPELARWLERRGEDPAAWEGGELDYLVRREAEGELGLRAVMDEGHNGGYFWGWRSDDEQVDRAEEEIVRVVDGFMLRLPLRRLQ